MIASRSMRAREVVVTGLGVISSVGITRDCFWMGLESGRAGLGPISGFETTGLPCHRGGEVSDFKAERFLETRGLKYLDRSTQLAASAAALALADSGLAADSVKGAGIGLILGTAFGSLDSISGFDQTILRDGPRAVNPMGFPKTVINSPAGHVAIRYGLTGPNTTISSGVVSSLQAIGYAADFIRMGRADLLLAGGVEELCLASYLGCCRMGLLSGSAGGIEADAAPFDVNRNGLSLSEGASILVLEAHDHAMKRSATPYGMICGFGSSHAARSADRVENEGEGNARAMRRALADAEIDERAVGCISASANGSPQGDAAEARAIRSVFGDRASTVPIQAIKSSVGEAMGASGALQVASGMMTLRDGIIPPTLGFRKADPAWNLGGIGIRLPSSDVRVIMVNAFGCDGISASIVIGRCGEA
jgi:3-oxoacyl-[acyl-carrier-protein] synthase II